MLVCRSVIINTMCYSTHKYWDMSVKSHDFFVPKITLLDFFGDQIWSWLNQLVEIRVNEPNPEAWFRIPLQSPVYIIIRGLFELCG